MTEKHYGRIAILIGIGATLFGNGVLYATYNPSASAFIGQYLTWLIAMAAAVFTVLTYTLKMNALSADQKGFLRGFSSGATIMNLAIIPILPQFTNLVRGV